MGKGSKGRKASKSSDADNDELCRLKQAPPPYKLKQMVEKMTHDQIESEVLDLITYLPLLDLEYKNCENTTIKLILTQKHLRQYHKYLYYSIKQLLREDEKYDYRILSHYFDYIDDKTVYLKKIGLLKRDDNKTIVSF